MQNNTHIYTEEQLMARLKFFIGICLSLTLFGIVFVVLYSLIFVTQPLNAISPIDSKFFELIIPIATFLTGTLSGIMLASPGDKEAASKALDAANKGWDKQPSPVIPTPAGPSATFGQFSAPMTPAFGNVPLSMPTPFAPPTPDFQPQVVTGFGGKPMPVQPPQPEI